MQILGNVVSANGGPGISLSSTTGTVIQGNDIGVAKDGVHALGNLNGGIQTSVVSNSLIGGTSGGDGNVIADNAHIFTIGGVNVDSASTGVAIEGNSIYSNFGVGVDLGGNGVTTNTPGGPHPGANDLQNYPVLTSSQTSAGATVIAGSLNSTPNTIFRVEFFASPGFDPTGYGQGKLYLGSTSVTTNASGNVSFTTTLTTAVPGGDGVRDRDRSQRQHVRVFGRRAKRRPLGRPRIQMTPSLTSNVLVGDTLAYSITATNNGPNAASNVVITDPLPGGLSYQSANSSQGTASIRGRPRSPFRSERLPPASALVSINVEVMAPGGAIVNTATISSSTNDPIAGNNSATVTTTVLVAPNITLTPNLTSPTYGQALSFQADVSGGGGQTNPTGNVQLLVDGNAVGTTVVLSGGTASVAPTADLGADTYSIALSYAGDANYLATTSTPITVTIAKADLTVTANPESMTYGGSLPTLAAALSGFVNGDTAAVVTGARRCRPPPPRRVRSARIPSW